MIEMIKRFAGYKAPIHLHLTCTLMHLTVSAQFNLVEALVYIQRPSTRYILNYPDLKYNEGCNKLNL